MLNSNLTGSLVGTDTNPHRRNSFISIIMDVLSEGNTAVSADRSA